MGSLYSTLIRQSTLLPMGITAATYIGLVQLFDHLNEQGTLSPDDHKHVFLGAALLLYPINKTFNLALRALSAFTTDYFANKTTLSHYVRKRAIKKTIHKNPDSKYERQSHILPYVPERHAINTAPLLIECGRIKDLEQALQQHHDPWSKLLASVAAYRTGHAYQSVVFLRNALLDMQGKAFDLDTRTSIFAKKSRLETTIDSALRPLDPMPHLHAAAYSLFQGKQDVNTQLSIATALAEKEPGIDKLVTLYASLLAHSARLVNESEYWAKAVPILRKNPVEQRLGESRNLVRIIKEYETLPANLVFKEYADEKALNSEQEAIGTLHEKAPEIKTFETIYTGYDDKSEKHYSVTLHKEGNTLETLLQQGNKQHMPEIISLLARLHSVLPKNLPKLSPREDFAKRLANKELEIPSEIARQLTDAYSPIEQAVLDDAVWVYNKDAHPGNWMIADDNIIVFDFEATQLIPVTFDLANLLRCRPFFTRQEERNYVENYLAEASSNGLPINPETFNRAYLNSAIHRLVAFASAWSSPTRPKMKPLRVEAITTALKVLDIHRMHEASHHMKYERDYASMTDGLNKLRAHFLPYTS